MKIHFAHNFYPFISLTAAVFQVMLIYYLLRLKRKSRATSYIIGFFCSFLLGLISIFLTNALVFWGGALWAFQDAWLALGAMYLVLFLYRFHESSISKEMLFFAGLFGVIALFSLIYSVYYAIEYIFNWYPSIKVNELYPSILPGVILIGVLVLIRRIYFHAELPSPAKDGWGKVFKAIVLALVHPMNPPTLAYRNFLLVILFCLVPAIGSVIAQFPPFSAILPAYIISLGVLIATAAFSLVFFNHVPEPFTFNVKLVGISLVAFLTVFATVGMERLETSKREHLARLEVEAELARKAILANDMTDLPNSIAYIDRLADRNEQSGRERMYSRIDNSVNIQSLAGMKTKSTARIAPIKLGVMDVKEIDNALSGTILSIIPLYKTVGHRFIHDGLLYEIGLDLTSYHNAGHRLSVKLMIQVVISSLLIVIIFPFFFKINILNPLKQLLNGVKQINKGILEVQIPVRFEDEIGFLTQSFNDMVQSLRLSNSQKDELNEELKKINEELETRVKARTAELHQANSELENRVRERTAELRQAKEEAEVANLARNNFLASVSHELRTPLHHILGFSQVILKRETSEAPEQTMVYNQRIQDAGHKLLSLVDDILDLSQMDMGQMELDLSEVKLRELLENSLHPIRAKDLKVDLAVNLNIPPELEGFTFIADETKLKQILFNLLTNAVKFTPDTGEINLGAKLNEKTIVIQVKDTGIGVPEGLRDSIFEKFYQARDGLRDKTPGVGLGLTISRQLVELHGGQLWVESEGEGQGSRFIFSIPV